MGLLMGRKGGGEGGQQSCGGQRLRCSLASAYAAASLAITASLLSTEPHTTLQWTVNLQAPVITHAMPHVQYCLYKQQDAGYISSIYHGGIVACGCRTAARSCTASGGDFTPQPCCTPICCISWYALHCLPAQAAPCTVFLSLACRMCICLSLEKFPSAISLHAWALLLQLPMHVCLCLALHSPCIPHPLSAAWPTLG